MLDDIMVNNVTIMLLNEISFIMKKTILITAGGTGGHVFPALSVAEKLKIQNLYNIIWVGATIGIENDIVPKNGFKLERIKISGLRNKGILRLLKMPFILLWAIIESIKIIRKHKPMLIVGFGGYATFPLCFAGWLCRCKVIIHEQNAIPGLSNKILSKFATNILTAFPDVLASKKSIIVGNPIRDSITKMSLPKERYNVREGGLNLLILGGSLGAQALNEVIPSSCDGLINFKSVLHQVGMGDAKIVQAQYDSLGISAEVVSFIDDIAHAYSKADLIICRSGASTVSEISCAGVAAIFVPYPYAVDNHQYFNAMPLVKIGGAKIIIQKDLNKENLRQILSKINRHECLQMAQLAHTLAISNSADRICKIIEHLVI